MSREQSTRSKTDQRLQEFEDELKKTKYNKRTQASVGLLKAKIARLREDQVKRASSSTKGEGYSVRKTGDATVILIGFPSVGKSTLLNKITNTHSEVAPYAFTTQRVIPGTLNYNSAKIQILDVPGIIHGAATGKGRGTEVLSCITNADLILFIIDALHPEHLKAVKEEAYIANVRINQHKPNVVITKKAKDGISIGSTVKLTHIDKETIKAVLREFRLNNADVIIRDDITVDQFIDVIENNKKYVPAVVVLNKVDLVPPEQLEKLRHDLKPDLEISAEQNHNIEKVKETIFKKLNLMRIYCKEMGKEVDMNEPMILKVDTDLKTMCEKLHKDFVAKFRFARIWGSSVKYAGQKVVKIGHRLKDKDIVEIHLT